MSKVTVPATTLPVYVMEEISAKTGNPYYQLCVDIDDRYTLKKFITNEESELLRIKLESKPAASAV